MQHSARAAQTRANEGRGGHVRRVYFGASSRGGLGGSGVSVCMYVCVGGWVAGVGGGQAQRMGTTHSSVGVASMQAYILTLGLLLARVLVKFFHIFRPFDALPGIVSRCSMNSQLGRAAARPSSPSSAGVHLLQAHPPEQHAHARVAELQAAHLFLAAWH